MRIARPKSAGHRSDRVNDLWGAPPPHRPPSAEERAALAEIYRDVDAALAPLGDACRACGRCCRFETGGVVLFASALELACLATLFADMTAADYGGSPALFTFTSWISVTDYLKTLSKACHVELDGHGAPGIFSWNGEVVLKNGSADTQAWLDSMNGHIKNLTFISCAVGQGSEGDGLLQMVTSTLGASGAYTEVIGAFGEPGSKTWYILNNGTYKVTPEPATLGFLAIGGLGLLFFSRRHAR